MVSPFIGGGFGSRGSLGRHTALVAHAARVVKRPVKLVATRDQAFTIMTCRAETCHRAQLGATHEIGQSVRTAMAIIAAEELGLPIDRIAVEVIKGVGELGNVGLNAAVANAVFHATGVRARKPPVRIEKLLGALNAA